MKNTYFASIIGSVVLATALIPGAASYAQTEKVPTSSSISVAAAAHIERLKSRADQEINRRAAKLKDVESRIASAKRISDADKTILTASLDGQIAQLTDAKTKIDAETDVTALRADVQSIVKSYRVFALVLPQAAIAAASDRAETIVDAMAVLAGKFESRVTDAQNAGNDVTALTAALTDYNARVADADTQAKAAIAEVAGLTPDNGDQTKFQANLAALKGARSKIQAAQKDFVAARKDAETVVTGLKSFERNASSTAETSSTSN